MNEIQCRMYRPDGTRCTLAPGHTEEEGAHGEARVQSTRGLVCEFIFADGITVPFEPGDFTFETIEPSPKRLVESMTGAYMRGLAPLDGVPFTAPEKPLDLSGSFTANLRDLEVGSIFEVLDSALRFDAPGWTSTQTAHLTVTWTEPRNPPIARLRQWAASASSTPWRRRSIASWRWLWRRTMAGTQRTLTTENVRIENGAIRVKGPPARRVSYRYDVVMMGVGE
jgi:hypothetical protein